MVHYKKGVRLKEMKEKRAEKETKRMQITLAKNMIDDLDTVGNKYNLSKSNIISMLVKKYLKEEFGNFEK